MEGQVLPCTYLAHSELGISSIVVDYHYQELNGLGRHVCMHALLICWHDTRYVTVACCLLSLWGKGLSLKSCKRVLDPAFAHTSLVPANILLHVGHDACAGGNTGGSSDISSAIATKQSHDTRQSLQRSRTAAHNLHGQDQKRCGS